MTVVNETWTHADSPGSLTADQSWTLTSGTTWGIVSNTAQNAGFEAGTTEIARCNTSVGTVDHEVSATLTTMTYGAGFTCFGGLICRKDNTATSTYYQLMANAQTSNYFVSSVTAGSGTTLGTGGSTPTVGDVLRLRATGTSIQAWVNGTLIVDVVDSSIPGSTFGGLASFLHGPLDVMAFDNWSLTSIGGAVSGAVLAGSTGKGQLTTLLTG